MMSHFDTLVRSNPMRIEIARFRRRFLGSGSPTLNRIALGLVALCYLGLVVQVMSLGGDMPPIALIMFQTGLFCFFGPAMLHGAIAGERERRSWDLLMVAPITKAQIVAGKFMGAMAALGVGAAMMALPIVFSALAYEKTTFYDLLLAEAVSLSFCTLVCAWTIFISARSNRPFTALGAALASLALGLIVVPTLLVTIFGPGERLTSEVILYANPFTALGVLASNGGTGPYGPDSLLPASLYGVSHTIVYLLLTLAFLVYAANTLRFAENEVGFLSRNHSP